METDDLYELVVDAVRTALDERAGGDDVRPSKRMAAGKVIFEDGEGRIVKEVDTFQFFRKVTSVREKLRVLEQKLNNHKVLSHEDKAELQALIARCYGSLTTFNFLFQDTDDHFVGQSSKR